MIKKRNSKIIKLISFTILMLFISSLLFVASRSPLFNLEPFESTVVNYLLNYQLSAFPVAALAAATTYLFAGKEMLLYLSSNCRGAMKSFTGKPGEGRWETDGWVIGFIMVAIMGAVVLLQALPNGFEFRWLYLLLVIPFAASNALIEEIIFRLSYVSVGKKFTKSIWYGLIMGSIIFGIFHYWGIMPNGLFGAVASAFLGYFLARSIQETQGFFWAFMIHFMLDVIILLFIFNLA